MQTNLDAVCQFTIGQDAEVSEFHFKCVTFYKRLKRGGSRNCQNLVCRRLELQQSSTLIFHFAQRGSSREFISFI